MIANVQANEQLTIRADHRSEHDHETRHTVGGADFLRREHTHDGRIHGRQHDAGADALDDSSGKHQRERRRHCGKQGTDEEAGERDQHEGLRLDPLEQEAHAWQHDADGEHVADDHPLCDAGGDVERVAQIRQCDVHGRFGQHAQKRADV
jgi:hypothetical protein